MGKLEVEHKAELLPRGAGGDRGAASASTIAATSYSNATIAATHSEEKLHEIDIN